MSDEPHPCEEGKRAGIHSLIVILGILLGLWLFVFLIVPSSKEQTSRRNGRTNRTDHRRSRSGACTLQSPGRPVLDMNAIESHCPSRSNRQPSSSDS